MEAQANQEVMPTISHEHANGAVFEAATIENAYRICEAAAKMSIQQFGILVELKTRGLDRLADQQNVPREKPVIKKVEKVQPVDNLKKVAELSTAEVPDEIVAEIEVQPLRIIEPVHPESEKKPIGNTIDPAMHDSIVRHIETVQKVSEGSKIFDDVDEVQVAKLVPNESVRPFQSSEALPIKAEQFEAIEESHSPITDLEVKAVNEVDGPTGVIAEIAPDATNFDLFEKASLETEDDQDTIEVSPTTIETEKNDEASSVKSILIEVQPEMKTKELPASIVEIEGVLELLVDTVEDASDESEKVNTILKEIINLPAQFEEVAHKDAQAFEEKLELLFGELFEVIKIDPSPELMKSFVALTKAHYLEELLSMAKNSEENQGLPDDIGTHEFLQLLSNGLSHMAQTVVNFYKIGRSIVHLYRYSFENVSISAGSVK